MSAMKSAGAEALQEAEAYTGEPLNYQTAADRLGLTAEARVTAETVEDGLEDPAWRRAPAEEPADHTGDVGAVEDMDPLQPERREYTGPVGDMVASGHGFSVETHASSGRDPSVPLRNCVVCGTPVRIAAPRWVCEISGDVTEVPTFPGYGRNGPRRARCSCNACALSSDVRARGRPPETCSQDCKRERDRRKRAEERDRQKQRQRDMALVWIHRDPTLSDRYIADQIDAPMIRVRDARNGTEESVGR